MKRRSKMENKENKSIKQKILLMFSGGRDSYLAACKLIEKGYYVHMITFDNGCTSNLKAVKSVAKTVIDHYGKDCAKYLGIWNTAWHKMMLDKNLQYMKPKDMITNYPELLPYEATCLCCRTSMYLVAIAYCKAMEIGYISEGARKQQGFFVELDDMKNRYEKLCIKNDIQLIWPVYEMESDTERKIELGRRGLLTKTLEPQCHIGRPQLHKLNEKEKESLSQYYDIEIEPYLKNIIQEDTLTMRRIIKKENSDKIC
ncbi:hypothetical protein DW886_15285 [Enterocloster aldenensis]|nr:hypothetical protein DW886_15285 [Enterocloster aldenensis]